MENQKKFKCVLTEEELHQVRKYPCTCTDECVYNKPITWHNGYTMAKFRSEFGDIPKKTDDHKDKT